ncbi:MAG: ribosome maturation factor RimP [Bacilli bacterium]|nr:ribosome maturation factor RimP [Bacilli bacterium]
MELEALKKPIESKLSELGYELYLLKSRKEGKNLVLEIVIDRVEPINMNDIVNVSNVLNALLDELDPFEEPYLLDVSSLGAEKPLKVEKLKDYIGSYIHLHMINPVDGLNIVEGTLENVDDEKLTISYKVKTRVKQLSTLLNNIYQIRLAIKF